MTKNKVMRELIKRIEQDNEVIHEMNRREQDKQEKQEMSGAEQLLRDIFNKCRREIERP